MKYLLLLFVISSPCLLTAQNDDYRHIPVKTVDDCKKAEPLVMKAAKLVLGSPVNYSSPELEDARIFVFSWMSGPSGFTFQIDGTIGKISKGKNRNLYWAFMAAESRFALENRDNAKDQKAIKMAAYNSIAVYCLKPENGVDLTKNISKFLDAYQNKKLDSYIGN
jgi:hypothetical protein